jgi:hypothetical protein
MKNNLMKCPIPNCPIKDDEQSQPWDKPDPKCKCGKGIHIYLRPGQHYHPCPVHPDFVIVGRDNGTL